MDWSYQLLSEDERTLLDRLSVFPALWVLGAAEHGQVACLRRLRLEQENVRSDLEWGLSSLPYAERGLELAGALFWFWTKLGLFEEGRVWLERALTVGGDGPARLRAVALIGLAHMAHFQGRHLETAARASGALALGREVGDAWVLSFALFMQALAAHECQAFDEAHARALEALESANACDEIVQRSGPLMILGNVALVGGEHERAQQFYQEAIDTSRRAGDTWGLGILLCVAAGLRTVRGDFDRARSQAAEALTRCHEFEDARGVAWSLDVCPASVLRPSLDQPLARFPSHQSDRLPRSARAWSEWVRIHAASRTPRGPVATRRLARYRLRPGTLPPYCLPPRA